MSVAVQHTEPATVLAGLHALLDQLQAADVTPLAYEDMLEFWRELERLRRRLPSVEHGLVLEAEARGLPAAFQLRGVAQLLRGLLRLDPREAAGRVSAAHAAGVRTAMTGQPLPAPFPQVAAAQAAGRSPNGRPASSSRRSRNCPARPGSNTPSGSSPSWSSTPVGSTRSRWPRSRNGSATATTRTGR